MLEGEKEELETRLLPLKDFEGLEGPTHYGEWNTNMTEEVQAKWDNRLRSQDKRVKVL